MSLQVIGAGLPRTGTSSLQIALNQLGFGPCHHMFEVLEDSSQWPLWFRVFDGEKVGWEEIYKGYNSAVDAPTAFLWRELCAAYPNAKVILTTRSPDEWRQSMLAAGAAIRAAPPNPQLAPFMQRSVQFFARISPVMLPRDDAAAFAAFDEHNKAVIRELPKERLLVFDAREGWGPLCDILGVPMPDTPYPRTNSAAEFAEFHRKLADKTSAQGERS